MYETFTRIFSTTGVVFLLVLPLDVMMIKNSDYLNVYNSYENL